MKNVSYYRAIQNTLTSQSKKEALTKIVQRNLDNDFYNTLDYDTVIFDYRTETIEQDLTITATKILDEFKINCKTTETFNLGEVFSWQESHWLITKISSDKRIKTKGVIKRCNYKLRFQNSKGEIVERWIVSQDASSYSTGIEENNVIRLGSDQLLIFIPADKETIAIERDKRFLIDLNHDKPTCYKLTRVDTTTYTVDGIGYCAWIVSEDQFNPDVDNKELMLCDYFEPNTPIVSDFDITYAGKPQIRIGGSAKTLTANADNPVTWELETIDIQTNKISLSDVGNNQCKVKCENDISLVGSSFKVKAITDDVESYVIINIVGGV